MRRLRSRPAATTGERYLGYEPAELNRQYDLLTRHEDSLEVFARLGATLSDEARSRFSGRIGIAYGKGAGETLDLFPAGDPDAPVVALLRGGYWQASEAAALHFIALGLAPHGCTVAVIDHAAPQEASLGDIVDQACRAVLWLRDHAGSGRMVLAGHGSGAHLAAMALTADWRRLEGREEAVCPIDAFVGLSGIYDMEPVRLSFLNQILKLEAGAVPPLSPRRLTPALPRPAPSVLLAVGERESDEFHRHMAGYAAALEDAGAPLSAVTLPGHHHFSLLAELANPSSEITKRVIALAAPAAAGDCDPI